MIPDVVLLLRDIDANAIPAVKKTPASPAPSIPVSRLLEKCH